MTDVLQISLLPGEVAVSAQAARISTILGSCVSVTLHHRRARFGGMNHFMLPRTPARGAEGRPHRFGDAAMEALLAEMRRRDPDTRPLTAGVFGGGAVVEAISSSRLGDENVAAARAFLSTHGIPVEREEVLGRQGLRVVFRTDENRVETRPVVTRPVVTQESEESLAQEVSAGSPRRGAGPARTLFVSPDETLRPALERWAAERGRPLCVAHDLFQARTLLGAERFEAVAVDPATPYLDIASFVRNVTVMNRECRIVFVEGGAGADPRRAIAALESLAPPKTGRRGAA